MQKKLLLALTLMAAGVATQAQVQKGDWLLGGTFSVSTSNGSSTGNPSSTTSNSNLSPELGAAVGKNSIIGIRGSLSLGTSKYGDSKATGTNYQVGAFWKKLFPINEKVGWYGDISGGYSHSITKYSSTGVPDQKSSASGFYAGLTPGVYYIPGKKILLNASIGGVTYTHQSTHTGVMDQKNSNFGVNLLNYFSFGISFILNKERQI